MCNKRLACALVAVLVVIVPSGLCLSGPGLKKPKGLAIPDSELNGTLSPESIVLIDDWLKYYAEMIREAKDEPDRKTGKEELILKGRDGLVRTFRSYESGGYRYTVAERAVLILVPLLKLSNPQKRLNAAMALSQMPQIPIQDALEEMITNDNAAVRYLGWKGYRRIRMGVLAQTSKPRKKMFDALKQRAGAEQAPPVIRAILSFMVFPPFRPAAVTAERYQEAGKKVREILVASLPRLCRRVIAGNAEMSEICRRGVDAIVSSNVFVATDKKQFAASLQMVSDLAFCAGVAYDGSKTIAEKAEEEIKVQEKIIENATTTTERINAEAKIAKAKAKIVEVSPAIVVNELLLRDCEEALNTFKGLESEGRRMPIKNALIDPKITPPRGAAVLRAVVEEWIEVLAKDGVKMPQYDKPAESKTRPASAPSN